MEFKADALSESFSALEGQEGVTGLRAEIDELKAKLRSSLIEAGRPNLATEQKSAAKEGFADFLRTGESVFEGKSVDNASLGAGGHAVPVRSTRSLIARWSPFHRSAASRMS